MMRFYFLVLSSLLILPACSSQQAFEGLKVREQNLCAQGPAVNYDECMSRADVDYRAYAGMPAEPEEHSSRSTIRQVRKFIRAFNRQDVEAMLALAIRDVRWMSVNGDVVSTETGDADELRQAMLQYFADRPSSHSKLLDISASGPFVTTLEQAGTRERRGQCATAVYEFSGELIKNVWYYPAHPCDTENSD